jgi:hypothetical protein
MERMKRMKQIVNNGHVIINTHDVMEPGHVPMVLMRSIVIQIRDVILMHMNVYLLELSSSFVYQSLVLEMELLIVLEQLTKENTVDKTVPKMFYLDIDVWMKQDVLRGKNLRLCNV